MKKFLKAGAVFLLAAAVSSVPALAASKKSAYPAAAKLMVGGEIFNVGAYNINGYNYFKLRDTAMILKDTEKSFSVDYNSEENKIILNTAEAYTPLGEEFAEITSSDAVSAIEADVKISCDGKDVSGVSAYNIDGYNYFKLRDVASIVNVEVGYDEETKVIVISPENGYINIKETKFPLYEVGCFHMGDSYCGIYFAENEETKENILNIEVIGATVSADNSKMEAFDYRKVPEKELEEAEKNLGIDIFDGVYVDYPFELGTYIEVRVYTKLTDKNSNTENHCYILTGDIEHYWDMYPDEQ